MKNSYLPVLVVCLSVLAIQDEAGAGQLYKWTDSNGEVHYSQFPPSAKEGGNVRTITVHSPPPQAMTKPPEAGGGPPGTRAAMSPEQYCAEQEAQHHYSQKCMELRVRQRDAERAKKQAAQESERQQRDAEQREELQQLQDRQVVAECRQHREIFCDETPKVIRLCNQYLAAKQACLNDPRAGFSGDTESCVEEKKGYFRKMGAHNCW